MSIRLSAAAVALAVLASTAVAQTPPTQATAGPPVKAATSKTAASDKMVCKSIASTGTRFVKHDCRTQADWDQLAADSRQATQDMSSRPGGPGH